MRELRALGMGLLVGAFGIVAFAAESQKVVDTKSVQKILSETHASWHAKESWVTRLDKSELHRVLGLKNLPVGELDFEAVRPLSQDSVDWRNKNSINWLGPVMNQGNCGSCVAFASVATLEAQVSISNGLPWLHPSYSPQDLFSCGGGLCEAGWQPGDAADFLKNTGIVDAACMTYSSGSTGEDVACSQKCAGASSRTYRIVGYQTPTNYGGSIEQVKAALKNGPLVTTLFVYYDFLTYAGGIYQHVTGAGAGGHAVSLVGYDDSKRAWLIRNSWGTEWGENGFAWVSWDDHSGVGANTWSYEVLPTSGYISVASPSDREYVSQVYSLSAKIQGSHDIRFHVKDSQGNEMNVLGCSVVPSAMSCLASLNTNGLNDGRYEIYAEAPDTKTLSQVREFFVINTDPKARITLAAAPGVDLSSALSGRPEFLIGTDSGSVPIQHLEFRVLDSHGKIATLKSNDLVLPKMKMGWRTITVPNGHYSLVVHGETVYQGKTFSFDSNRLEVDVKN